MIAEIITIGDEILIGQTVDTNSAWMAQELNKLGVRVNRSTTIADEADEIVSTLDDAFARADLVLITGGLGPTNDDITKKALTEYFDDDMVENEEALERITDFFLSRGRERLQVNIDQALVPRHARIVQNHKGTASGMWFERDAKVAISMPGVPYEMKHLMRTGFLAMIAEHFDTQPVFHHTVMTFGEGESYIAEKVRDWELGLADDGVKVAYLPSPGIVKMRLTAFGHDDIAAKVLRQAAALEALIPELVYGYNDEGLEDVVGRLLAAKGKKVATAESCTGGYIAHLFTSVPGSSQYYEGSFCTYSYKSKSDILSVNPETIIEEGAVSREVVEAMALGLFNQFDVDYSIAVSGIAGPGGGTDDKPVGTVWMSVGTKDKLTTRLMMFGRNRGYNIRMTALHALNELRLQLISL